MADHVLLARARQDLGAFAELVGRPLATWQAASLTLERRTTVIVAPRQTGKSRSLAVLALHRAFRTAGIRVLVVSAGEDAAKRLLSEVRAVAADSPLLAGSVVDELASLVTLSNGSEIRSVPASERAVRGWTVDLLIVDEAASVEDDLLHGAALPTTAARPDARIVLAGSPRGTAGAFYEAACRGFAGTDVHTVAVRWRLRDATWISAEAIAALREGLPPALARAELDGEFADIGDGLRLFEDAWIDAAVARELPGLGSLAVRDRPGGGPLRLGVDVARSGHDETVGVQVRGGRVRVAFAGHGWDLMRTAEAVVRATCEDRLADSSALAAVDETGLGAGVVDRARQLGAPVRGFVSAARARQPQRYANVRAEAYSGLADALRDGLLDLDASDRVLIGQLRQVRWTTDRLGRILIESKDALRARGVVSPDRADAVVMALSLDAAWRPREVLSAEDRAARELEEALAIHARAVRVQEARLRWNHPKDWAGGSVMGNVLGERW
ncbi:MAG: AAA family ATPase [Solirubrobacteraceae bacterium]|nr:AAA family ATPase [Solirubrobacteraceae bacterium]